MQKQLAAEAFGAAHAFLMVGRDNLCSAEHDPVRRQSGAKRSSCPEMSTAASWERMVLERSDSRLCESGRRISGWASRLGMSVEAVEKAIQENPDAKAVLVNNPTYYGICSDLQADREAGP